MIQKKRRLSVCSERIIVTMDDVCRLCSMEGRPMVSIFCEAGMKQQLNEKISNRLLLTVTEDDLLSKNVCYNCCGKLEIFDQYVLEVRKTQTVLQKQAKDLFKIKQNNPIKNEETDTIEIGDDNCHSNDSDHRVSVIRYPPSQLCNTDKTTPSNISSPDRKEIIRKYCDETKNVENKRGRKTPYEVKRLESNLKFSVIRKSTTLGAERRLRSNPKHHFFRRNISKKKINNFEVGKRIERKAPVEANVPTKKDFCAQNGNTLQSDLKSLKNSLLLRKVETRNASVFTIPVTTLPNTNCARPFIDTMNSKGSQTEILIAAKSESNSRIVFQKVSFEGRSFLDITENNAIITSNLPV